MNSKAYRWCAVPLCTNTSIKTPEKLFIFVPFNKTIRNKWLKLARRDLKGILPTTQLYFCEDHFDLPNDMENYMEYHVMGSVSQIRMKRGCVPLKFHCQTWQTWNKQSNVFSSEVFKPAFTSEIILFNDLEVETEAVDDVKQFDNRMRDGESFENKGEHALTNMSTESKLPDNVEVKIEVMNDLEQLNDRIWNQEPSEIKIEHNDASMTTESQLPENFQVKTEVMDDLEQFDDGILDQTPFEIKIERHDESMTTESQLPDNFQVKTEAIDDLEQFCDGRQDQEPFKIKIEYEEPNISTELTLLDNVEVKSEVLDPFDDGIRNKKTFAIETEHHDSNMTTESVIFDKVNIDNSEQFVNSAGLFKEESFRNQREHDYSKICTESNLVEIDDAVVLKEPVTENGRDDEVTICTSIGSRGSRGKSAQYYRDYRARKRAEQEKESLNRTVSLKKRKSAAEYQREYRARKKAKRDNKFIDSLAVIPSTQTEGFTSTDQSNGDTGFTKQTRRKTPAEYQREYRARKKALRESTRAAKTNDGSMEITHESTSNEDARMNVLERSSIFLLLAPFK